VKFALALVEGQTEERFIKTVLQQHLEPSQLWLTPRILHTSGSGMPVRKGGVSSWRQLRRELQLLLNDSNATVITTMLDFYALPRDVPGVNTAPSSAPKRAQAEHIESEMAKDLQDPRFHPYLSLHELEALLFADVDVWADRFDAKEILQLKADVEGLQPEDINDNYKTAPSRRLARHLSTYRKTQHGPDCAKDIGLDILRLRCPHFGEWLSSLERA
jgi:Domain of unknown function (DUF4276)